MDELTRKRDRSFSVPHLLHILQLEALQTSLFWALIALASEEARCHLFPGVISTVTRSWQMQHRAFGKAVPSWCHSVLTGQPLPHRGL